MGEHNNRRNGLQVIEGGKTKTKIDGLVAVRAGEAKPLRQSRRESLGEVLEIHDEVDEPYVIVQFQTTQGLKSTSILKTVWREMSKTSDLELGYIIPRIGMRVLMTSVEIAGRRKFHLTLAA